VQPLLKTELSYLSEIDGKPENFESNIKLANGDLKWKKIKEDFLDRKLAEEDSDYSVDSGSGAPLHFTLNDPDQIRKYCKSVFEI
jgi:hypothetical protein